MKIEQKLGLGFGVILAMLIIVGVIGILQLDKVVKGY